MSFNMDKMKTMQNTLDKSKEMIDNLNNKFEKIEYENNFEKADRQYKKLCSQFSPAYLSGSSWYVGESLRDAKINTSDMRTMYFLGSIFG